MAARSVTVNVQNRTGITLTLLSARLAHGRWTEPPPSVITSSGAWQSESAGVLTGTEGTVEYTIAGVGTVSLHWNNPFVGGNSYAANASDAFRAETVGGVGDNAVVDLRLELSAQPLLKRPFYAVGHRANSVAAIRSALAAGANAVECDIRRTVVDHDGTFRWSTRVQDWLRGAAIAASDFSNFCLVYFDIKEPDAAAEIQEMARQTLPESLQLLYSIARYEDRDSLRALLPSLRTNEALAIDEHDDPHAVAAFFADVGAPRCWYGNGVFVAGPPTELPVIEASVREAVRIRDSDKRLSRVAVWTLARQDSMADYLKLGADAILVNERAIPTVLSAVRACRHVRLALREDSVGQY